MRAINPFEFEPIQAGRRTGHTTRLVDYFIQELFETGETVVYELPKTRGGSQSRMNIHIMDRFMRRLESEHPGLKVETDKKHVSDAVWGYSVKLKKNKVEFSDLWAFRPQDTKWFR